jgi:uncharacterized protein (DUF488 family)
MRDAAVSKTALVLTVGHSDRTLEEFLQLLRAHRVKLVADVRKMPGSRANPQFNSATLAQALRAATIGYVHLPRLGGLRRPRLDSPNAAWRNLSFRGYADYMLTPEFDSNLEELLQLARGQRVALMCAEALPWRCHRSLIADALVVRGVRVEHIFNTSRARPHVLRSWACVRGTRTTYPALETSGANR